MTATLRIRDRGLEALREQLAELRRLRVRAGVQGKTADTPHPTAHGLTFAELAAVHEYGAGRIPARPYLRTAAELSAERNRRRLRVAISDVVDGRATPVEALAAIGRALVEEIEETIDRAKSWAVPLAAITIRRKGHDRPLVETLELRGANTWAVVDGDRVLAEG